MKPSSLEVALLKARVTVHNLPVHTPFAIASGTMQAADCAIVEIADDDGHTGLGEAAPFSAATGEEIKLTAGVMRALCDEIALSTPESAIRDLARAAARRSLPRSALCAVECAILDLIAQRAGLPLWRLFGSPSGDQPAPLKTDITIPVMKPADIPQFLEKFARHEFDSFKIKVCGDVDQDTESVRTANHWSTKMGRSNRIILDGNQGFDLRRSRQLLANLEKLRITATCFEQPLPRHDLKGLAELSRTTTVPVLLDESVTSGEEVYRAHSAGAGSMINIKITKSGVIESLRMITAAKSLGLGMMIGGMLETEIAMGFSLQMAAGLGGFEMIDLDTPFFIDRRITVESPWHRPSASLTVPNLPGSGLKIS